MRCDNHNRNSNKIDMDMTKRTNINNDKFYLHGANVKVYYKI